MEDAISKENLLEIKLTPAHKGRMVYVYNRFIKRKWIGELQDWTPKFCEIKIGKDLHSFNRESVRFYDKPKRYEQ